MYIYIHTYTYIQIYIYTYMYIYIYIYREREREGGGCHDAVWQIVLHIDRESVGRSGQSVSQTKQWVA